MRNLICPLLSLISIFSISSCEEVIDPGLPKGYKRLVVEGWITDQPGPYVVRLTQTRDYAYTYTDTLLYEKEAEVIIKDDLGNSETLREIAPGTYITDTTGMRGIIGRSYRLFIKTREGKEYISENELLRPVPPIDTLYYELGEYTKTQDGNRGIDVNFFSTLHDPVSEKNYYLRKYQETGGPDGRIWSVGYDVLDDKFFDGNKLVIQNEGYLGSGYWYYLEVTQYSLSLAAFKFWTLIELRTEETGGPYDPPSAPILGNIYNINDNKDYALGYFGASGVSRKEIIVKN